MTAHAFERGTVFRCPHCGAEILVLAGGGNGDFRPRCCNLDMVPLEGRVRFFVCPVCKAEIAVLHEGRGDFRPRCCHVEMVPA